MSARQLVNADASPSALPFRVRVRTERCALCGREFRGIYPRPVRLRHEAEHRYDVIAKVATS